MALTDTKSEAAAVLTDLLRGIVARRDEIRVEESIFTKSVTYSVYTSHKDYGRVIGTNAKNFKCFEFFAKLMAARDEREAQLSVVSPDNKVPPKDDKFAPNPKWGKAQLLPMVQKLCAEVFESAGVIDIRETDPMSMTVEIKVNNEDPLVVIDGGDRIGIWFEKDHVGGEEVAHDIDLKLVEKKMSALFYAIGRNNGRNVKLYLIGVNYPGVGR